MVPSDPSVPNFDQQFRADLLTRIHPEGGSMADPEKTTPVVSDVLHSEGHSKLSAEEIAKESWYYMI